jgi:hypothetical protein
MNDGMKIDLSDEHEANADFSGVATRHPLSNVTLARLWPLQKHAAEMTSTDEGIQIDFSDAQPAKAASPRVETLETLSNSTFSRYIQFPQLWVPMIATEEYGPTAARNSSQMAIRPNWKAYKQRQFFQTSRETATIMRVDQKLHCGNGYEEVSEKKVAYLIVKASAPLTQRWSPSN